MIFLSFQFFDQTLENLMNYMIYPIIGLAFFAKIQTNLNLIYLLYLILNKNAYILS